MSAALSAMPQAGVVAVLRALGLSLATFYRQRRSAPRVRRPRPPSHRALDHAEQERVLSVLHSERFVDRSPAAILATLADEGVRLCSERTMYRILAAHDEVRERRNQLRHPAYAKPELVATAPNQVWSWDITKLRLTVKFAHLHLYVIIDIFSRYVVGWMLAHHENARLAERFIGDTVRNHNVQPLMLTLHADRGAPMRSKTVAQLLSSLAISASFSRPQVSDDNPFSESHFRTLKYHPGFPERFAGYDDAHDFCASFFEHYNQAHMHSGICHLAPADVHFGRAPDVLARRHHLAMTHYAEHPERYPAGPPKPAVLPDVVYINPPSASLPAPAGEKPPQERASPPRATEVAAPSTGDSPAAKPPLLPRCDAHPHPGGAP